MGMLYGTNNKELEGQEKCECCKGSGKAAAVSETDPCEYCYGTGKIPIPKADNDITNWYVLVAPDFPIKGCCVVADVKNNDIDGSPNTVLISPLENSPEAAKHIRILSNAHRLLQVCEDIYAGKEVKSSTLRILLENAYGEDINKIMSAFPEVAEAGATEKRMAKIEQKEREAREARRLGTLEERIKEYKTQAI